MTHPTLLPTEELLSRKFHSFTPILGSIEQRNYSADVRFQIAVPRELNSCGERRELFAQLIGRYSAILRVYGSGDSGTDSDLVVDGGSVSLHEITMLCRVLPQTTRVAILNKQEMPERVILYDGLRLPLASLDSSLSESKICMMDTVWRAYEFAARCKLYVVGKKSKVLADELGLEFGFADAEGIEGKSNSSYQSRIKSLISNELNVCIATRRLGHAHTKNLELQTARTRAEQRKLILNLLKEKVQAMDEE